MLGGEENSKAGRGLYGFESTWRVQSSVHCTVQIIGRQFTKGSTTLTQRKASAVQWVRNFKRAGPRRCRALEACCEIFARRIGEDGGDARGDGVRKLCGRRGHKRLPVDVDRGRDESASRRRQKHELDRLACGVVVLFLSLLSTVESRI